MLLSYVFFSVCNIIADFTPTADNVYETRDDTSRPRIIFRQVTSPHPMSTPVDRRVSTIKKKHP